MSCSGNIGISSGSVPVACATAASTAGAGPSIGSSPIPLLSAASAKLRKRADLEILE